MLPNFSYVRARSLEEAIDQVSSEGARPLAGGTDLLGCLRDGVFPASKVVSLNGIRGLRGLRESREGGLRIGALTRISDVAAHPLVRSRYPVLAQGASSVASPQLRNQGTLGGNLCQKPRCWYYRGEFDCLRKGGPRCYAVSGQNQFHCVLGGTGCYIVHPSDTAPALAALGATVRIAGPRGTRIMKAENFHLPPAVDPERETVLELGELMTEIELPPPSKGLRSSYRKVRARQSWDFALAGVALALSFEGERVASARIVLSGAAPVPWRSKSAEETVAGKLLDEVAAAEAAAAAMEEASPLEHNRYKLSLFRGLLEEQLLALGS